MKKELTENEYTDAWINSNGQVVIGEDPFDCDLTQLVPHSRMDVDGYVVDSKTKKRYDFDDAEVVAEVALDKVDLSDDLSTGSSKGNVINKVWIGDHYQLIVRTDDDEDFVVNTPYNWNENDMVSVTIKKEDIKLRLKGDLDNYVVQ
jgi:spermidine/putrescine transport system ATP-binding protein